MSYWHHQKPAKRERAVDVLAVARAAAALLEEGGTRALTLRAVAARLTVAPASLYSRITSVEDLFDLALDATLSDDPDVGRAIVKNGLTELLLTYYRHLVKHKWACQVIAMRPPRGPGYLRLSERMCELLLDAGAEDPLGAAYALSNFVIGSASTSIITENEAKTPVDPAIAPIYALLHVQHRNADAENILLAGLSAILTHVGRVDQCSHHIKDPSTLGLTES